MNSRLSTGIGPLDRKMGGGIPPGSLVLLSASPASQSEQLLAEFTHARRTLVLTTRRPRDVVEDTLSEISRRPRNIAVREIDMTAPLDHLTSLVEVLDGETNIVIDPLDPLEQCEEHQYIRFLNRLRAFLTSIDSIAVFHCLSGASVPERRDLTTYMSDVVFDLTTTVRGEDLENRLAVPKFRGGRPFEEAVKLELTDKVAIDTSRDIG